MTKEMPVAPEDEQRPPPLPEWGESDLDDATWIAALEASRRAQFADLADL